METETKKPELKNYTRTKQLHVDMQIEEFFQQKKVRYIYEREFLLQKSR